jgi:hypothetical protein
MDFPADGRLIMADEKFCSVEHYSVLIPYRDLVKIAEMAKNYEVMQAQYNRLEEQYAAMRGMFSEVLDVVREIREYVRDT